MSCIMFEKQNTKATFSALDLSPLLLFQEAGFHIQF